MKRASAFALLAAVLAIATPALASFHLWDIDQIYSDPSGTIQYVRMYVPDPSPFGDGQEFLSGQSFTSNTNTLNFGSDLPGSATSQAYFLIGSSGYQTHASTHGLPAPDYTISSFFDVFVELNISMDFAGVDSLNTPMSTLPLDGSHALQVDHDTLALSSVSANPINFAGDSALLSVPEPAAAAFFALGAAGLLTRRQRA